MANKPTPNNDPLTKSVLESALAKYATKSDLKKTVKDSERILRAEILRVEERLENVEDRLTNKIDSVEAKVDKMGATIEKISIQLDGFVGRVDDLTNDNIIGTDQIHELRRSSKDHEKRIAKLESV
jgi:uncharacterized coiled-coil protein SlyX